MIRLEQPSPNLSGPCFVPRRALTYAQLPYIVSSRVALHMLPSKGLTSTHAIKLICSAVSVAPAFKSLMTAANWRSYTQDCDLEKTLGKISSDVRSGELHLVMPEPPKNPVFRCMYDPSYHLICHQDGSAILRPNKDLWAAGFLASSTARRLLRLIGKTIQTTRITATPRLPATTPEPTSLNDVQMVKWGRTQVLASFFK